MKRLRPPRFGEQPSSRMRTAAVNFEDGVGRRILRLGNVGFNDACLRSCVLRPCREPLNERGAELHHRRAMELVPRSRAPTSTPRSNSFVVFLADAGLKELFEGNEFTSGLL